MPSGADIISLTKKTLSQLRKSAGPNQKEAAKAIDVHRGLITSQ